MKRDKIELFIIFAVVLALGVAAVYGLKHLDAQALYLWYKDHMTYGIIILLMAIESSIIPLPSEVVVPPAAYFALQDNSDLNIWMVILTATIGAVLGAAVNYGLSMLIGRPIIYRFADSRWGKLLMLNSEKLENAENYFKKRGNVSIFFGRLLPAVRHLISIPAGLSRMNFGKFTLYTTLGAAIWNFALAGMGYLLYLAVPDDSQLFDQIEHYNTYIKIVGYSIVALLALYFGYKYYKNKKSKKTEEVVKK